MSASDSQIFVVESFPKAEDFLTVLDPLNPRWIDGPATWIFRGQRDAQWDLTPSILRKDSQEKFHHCTPLLDIDFRKYSLSEDEGRKLLNVELALIREFHDQADRHGLSLPEFGQSIRDPQFRFLLKTNIHHATNRQQPNSCWPDVALNYIIALAQHYGIPTRLLDWTWHPATAAYFACMGGEDGKGSDLPGELAVWALRTDFIEDDYYHFFPDSVVSENSMLMFRYTLLTAPQGSNPNLRAQAGVFVVDRDILNPVPLNVFLENENRRKFENNPRWLENVARKYPRIGERLPVLRKLQLPRSEAMRLGRLLAIKGTSAASVFPGYAGVVDSLKERARWKV